MVVAVILLRGCSRRSFLVRRHPYPSLRESVCPSAGGWTRTTTRNCCQTGKSTRRSAEPNSCARGAEFRGSLPTAGPGGTRAARQGVGGKSLRLTDDFAPQQATVKTRARYPSPHPSAAKSDSETSLDNGCWLPRLPTCIFLLLLGHRRGRDFAKWNGLHFEPCRDELLDRFRRIATNPAVSAQRINAPVDGSGTGVRAKEPF